MYETRFRDRGIEWLCMKHVSGIGVLIASGPFVLPLLLFVSMLEVVFVIRSVVWGGGSLSPLPPPSSTIHRCISCLPPLPLMFKSAWITWSVP